MNYTTDTYLFKCLTNMHVGSGDANYGIIDKQVQRDVVSTLPTIHASGIKGAFRQQFEQMFSDPTRIVDIFGSENNSNKQNDFSKAGSYRFFNAHLLVLPVRSNTMPFFRAFSLETLQQFYNDLLLFKTAESIQKDLKIIIDALVKVTPKKDTPLLLSNQTKVVLEDYNAQPIDAGVLKQINSVNVLEPLLGENLALFHHDDFKNLCKNLPVIARNHLDNGQSVNLWYEEIVPRESLFYSMIARPTDNNDFDLLLKAANNNVQIGANASVGYGFCKTSKL